MIPCLFKTLFGIECLGCGFQRSVFLLFKGEFWEAFKMYPAVYTTLIFFGFVALYFLDQSGNHKKKGLEYSASQFNFYDWRLLLQTLLSLIFVRIIFLSDSKYRSSFRFVLFEFRLILVADA
jgi:hypothetical protein